MSRFARSPAPLALLAILCLLSRARADGAPAQPGAMTVAYLEGTATATAPGESVARALAQGAQVAEGATVATGLDSRLELAFASGTRVRLGEKTRLELRDAPLAGGRFRARLWAGNFWAHVHKLLVGERFELETDNAVAGVRGTIFRVEVVEGAPDLLRVYEGAVQVDGKLEGYSARVLPGASLSFARAAQDVAGPRPFDPALDASGKFMQWVSAREKAQADKADQDDKRERTRDRLRRLLRHE